MDNNLCCILIEVIAELSDNDEKELEKKKLKAVEEESSSGESSKEGDSSDDQTDSKAMDPFDINNADNPFGYDFLNDIYDDWTAGYQPMPEPV
jgi:hypothetical protein